MDYELVQYGCDNCGKVTAVLDPDAGLPKGWVMGNGRHQHYCPGCAKKLKKSV